MNYRIYSSNEYYTSHIPGSFLNVISDDNSGISLALDVSHIVQNIDMGCTFTVCYGDMGAVGFY